LGIKVLLKFGQRRGNRFEGWKGRRKRLQGLGWHLSCHLARQRLKRFYGQCRGDGLRSSSDVFHIFDGLGDKVASKDEQYEDCHGNKFI
jgi:hypothetical protein